MRWPDRWTADAGRELGEVEEVAIALRQLLDLLRRDVRGDLRRLRVGELIADHGDGLAHDERGELEIEVDGLSDAQ